MPAIDWMRHAFQAYAYPAIVLSLLVALWVGCARTTFHAPSAAARSRRIVAVTSPLVIFVLVTAGTPGQADILWEAIGRVPGWTIPAAGLGLGVGFVELARFLNQVDDEVGPAAFGLLLSTLAVALLWASMFGAARPLQWGLAGGIAGASLTIVYRGLPGSLASAAEGVRR